MTDREYPWIVVDNDGHSERYNNFKTKREAITWAYFTYLKSDTETPLLLLDTSTNTMWDLKELYETKVKEAKT